MLSAISVFAEFCCLWVSPRKVVSKTVVTCKIKHLQKCLEKREVEGSKTFLQMFCKCFILHVTTAKTSRRAVSHNMDTGQRMLRHFGQGRQ